MKLRHGAVGSVNVLTNQANRPTAALCRGRHLKHSHGQLYNYHMNICVLGNQ